ncbi:hypothetical protein L6270_01445 [Candidatus Parcubacteria bacterium]|nr:hypothetical protein [Patescibacteria group bacterium]MBU4309804.1 hypothetical protein [Patescibacteria group bacterium]MBU4432200.1 hypothetical protein [Patescibacteria group bacterium]MBU4578143.1 hypothetical protein [Patescibacteria group bacterium]MCG2696680.1 hypothetical protein [Candidatus Parcubacteria bacterium]
MNDKYWTFEFLLHITGKTYADEKVELEKTIKIPLLVTTEKAAEEHAGMMVKYFTTMAKVCDTKYFKKYCKSINDKDGLLFSDFRIFHQGKRTLREKKLDLHVPEITAGP